MREVRGVFPVLDEVPEALEGIKVTFWHAQFLPAVFLRRLLETVKTKDLLAWDHDPLVVPDQLHI